MKLIKTYEEWNEYSKILDNNLVLLKIDDEGYGHLVYKCGTLRNLSFSNNIKYEFLKNKEIIIRIIKFNTASYEPIYNVTDKEWLGDYK